MPSPRESPYNIVTAVTLKKKLEVTSLSDDGKSLAISAIHLDTISDGRTDSGTDLVTKTMSRCACIA